MFKRFHSRKGFTLIELMIVVVILKQIYTMQRAYRQEQGTYAHNADVKVAGEVFEDIGVEIQGEAKYTYTMAADANTFSCTATVNLDDDAAIDSWTIDQDGDLAADCDDVVEVAACA